MDRMCESKCGYREWINRSSHTEWWQRPPGPAHLCQQAPGAVWARPMARAPGRRAAGQQGRVLGPCIGRWRRGSLGPRLPRAPVSALKS